MAMNHPFPGAHSTGGPSMWTHCSPSKDSAAESRVWNGDREVIPKMPESSTSCIRSVRFLKTFQSPPAASESVSLP